MRLNTFNELSQEEWFTVLLKEDASEQRCPLDVLYYGDCFMSKGST